MINRIACAVLFAVLGTAGLSPSTSAECVSTSAGGQSYAQSALTLPVKLFSVGVGVKIVFSEGHSLVLKQYCRCSPPCPTGDVQYTSLRFRGTTKVFDAGVAWEEEIDRCEPEITGGAQDEMRTVTLSDMWAEGIGRYYGGSDPSIHGTGFQDVKAAMGFEFTPSCKCQEECPETDSHYPVASPPGKVDLVIGETAQVTITAMDDDADLQPNCIRSDREAGTVGSLFDVDPVSGGGSCGSAASATFTVSYRDVVPPDLALHLATATLSFAVWDDAGHVTSVEIPVALWRGRPTIEIVQEDCRWDRGEYLVALRVHDPDLDPDACRQQSEVLTCEIIDVMGGVTRPGTPYSLHHNCSSTAQATSSGVTHTVGFTPNMESGEQHFTLKATDAVGHEAALVVPVNHPPTVSNETLILTTTSSGVSTSGKVDVLSSYRDLDGDPLAEIEIISDRDNHLPAHGSVGIEEDLTITYTTYPGHGGVDSFSYRVSDDRERWSAPATVTVRVMTPPTAFDFEMWGHPDPETLTGGSEMWSLDIDSLSLSAVDLDAVSASGYEFRVAKWPDGASGVEIMSLCGGGIVGRKLCDQGNCAFDPDEKSISLACPATIKGPKDILPEFGAAGARFPFTVWDPDSHESNMAVLTVLVSNAAPGGESFYLHFIPFRFGEAMIYPLEPAWYEAGCLSFSDPDGDPLTFCINPGPRLGRVDPMPSGGGGQYTVTLMYYIDRADALEAHRTRGKTPYIDRFTVVAEDPFGATAETAVEVTVDVINSNPVCVDDEATTPMGTPIEIDVLANDSDVDEDELSIVSVSEPRFGASSVSHIMIRYEPLPSFYGDDTFTYTAADGYEGENEATVTVHVVDTEPPVFITGPGDIGPVVNDVGVCGAAATWTEPVIDVDVTDNIGVANLTCTHAPGDVFPVGSTTVTYTATDPSGNAAEWAFTVTIEDHELPVIDEMPSDMCVEAAEGETEAVVIWAPPTASDNCAVADLTSSHAPGAVFPLGGTVVTYSAVDVHGNVASAAFTVTVAGPWQLVCSDVEVSTGNPGGTTVTFGTPVVGGCSVDYTFDPASGSMFPIGSTLVTCEATDGARIEACTFTVTVVFSNQPPNAVNDIVQMGDHQIVIEIDVLANDSDPDGDHLTIESVGSSSPCGDTWIDPSGGSVWFLATYCQPFLGGTALFAYTISDGHGETDTATVILRLPTSGTMPEVAPPPGDDR